MKKIILMSLLFISFLSKGQSLHPVKWTFRVEGIKDGEAELVFSVKMEKDWHIYSQFTPDGGPLPMLFKFDSTSCYSLIGKVSEPKPMELYDSLFGLKVLFLEKEAVLRQKVKLKGNPCVIKGSISYQACKEMCIALDTTFIFKFDIRRKDKSELPLDKPVEGNIPNGKPDKTETNKMNPAQREIFIHSF